MKRTSIHFKKQFLFQKAVLLVAIFLLISLKSWSVTYYSWGNTAPNLTTSWWVNNNGTGAHPANFTTGDIFIIQATSIMTTSAGWTVSGAGSGVQVSGGLVASFAVSAPTWTFNSGSTYTHAQNGGTIPTATWNASSTCNITGMVATAPGGIGQTFGNFTWNCAGQTNINYLISGDITVNGNFTLTNGTFVVTNGTVVRTLTILGNYNQTGGIFNFTTGALNSNLYLSGNLTHSAGSGTLYATGSAPNATITFNGSGTQTISFVNSTGPQWMVFRINAGSTIQLLSNLTLYGANSAGNYGAMTVNGTIDVGTYTISDASGVSGSTRFTLNSGATIITANATGLTGSIPSANTTKTFSAGAKYIYDGIVNQSTGAGLPTGLTGKITINNGGSAGNNTVTLSNAEAVANGGSIDLVAGIFANGTNLTLSTATSTINRSGGSMTGAIQGAVASTYNVNYTGNSKTTSTELSGAGLNNVTVNLTAGQTLTLDQNRIPDGNVTINTGNTFDLSTFTLNRSAAGGTLTVAGTLQLGASNFPSNFTTLTMTGGTVNYDNSVGGQTISATPVYNNLTLSNTSGTETAGGALTVNGTLTSTAGGTLNMVTNQLLGTLTTITNGGTIQTQNLTATPIPTGKTWGGTIQYNATTGAQTAMAGTYNNLTLSNTSGTETASGALTVNGTLITTAGGTLNMVTNQLLGTLTTVTNGGTIQTQDLTATPIPTGKTWGGTVQYNALTGAQTAMAGTYNNLTLSNTSGTETASGALTVNGTLITTAGGTLNMVTNQLLGTLTTVTNGGTIQTQNTSATPIPTGKTWGGTVQYNATTGGQTVMAGTYGILNNNNTSNTNSASGAITATTLNTSGGGTLNLATYALSVTNVTNAGIIRTQNTSATPISSGLTWGGTVQYDATTGGQTVIAGIYGILNNNNTSNTNTASGAITTTTLNTSAGGTLNMVTFALGVTNVTNAGTIRTQNTSATPISSGLTWGGTVTFDASTSQTIPGSTFNNLTINNSSGVTLSANATVNNTLTLSLGNITTGANTLIISNNATGAVSHTSGQVVGNLKRAIAGSPVYTFDVGTATSYTPVSIAFTTLSVAGNLTVSVTSGQNANSGSPVNTAKDVNLYWTLTNAGVACTSYAPTFTYNAGDIIGGAAQTSFIVGKYAAAAWTAPTPVTNGGSGPYTTNVTGQTTYGDFVAGENIPSIVLSDNAPQVTAAGVAGGTSNVVLHKSVLAVTLANATLTGMTCTTAGTYASADITNLKVYYQTTSTFNAGTLLSTLTTPGTAGAKTFTSFTSQTINSGTTGYIYITADVAPGATVGNTINLSALAASDFTFTAATKSGSTTAGGAQNFTTATYYNKSSGASALQTLSNWGTNTDGTGSAPVSFTANNQIFNIYNGASATIGGTWTVSGTNSKVVLGNTSVAAIPFTVPSGFAFSGTIDITAASSGSNTLTIQNATVPTLGTLNSGSTVVYGYQGASQTVTAATYGNLTISGLTGTTTFTLGGITTVAGNLSITAGTLDLGTYTANRSSAGGTLTIAGTLLLGGTTGGQTGSNFPDNFTTLTMAGGTVNYDNAGGGQTVYLTPSYNNLTMGNTGGIQLAGGNLSATTLVNTAGGTMNMAANTLSITNITNNGTIRTQNVSALPLPAGKTWGGTVQYDATTGGQTVMAGIYGILNNNNTSNTNTASGAITATTLNTSAGGTLNLATYALSVTNVTNPGIIRTQNVSALPLPTGKTWGGTVQYDATTGGQTIMAGIYGILNNNNTSNTNTASGAITTTTLNTSAGGTLNMVTFALGVTNVINAAIIRTQNTSATPISSGLTWGGTVIFDGSSAQTIPVSTFNNLTLSNTTGAGLGGAVNVNNTLTLTSGILTTSATNLLSVTNTATTAISGGSTTSFINGPVKWTLPASLVSGSTYNFPVGKGATYLPFALVNPTTGTGAVTAQVEAFTASTGGTFDGTLASISATEYWSLVTAGNFTNSTVSLTRQTAITPLDAIGGSATLAGSYTTLAGTAGVNGVTGSNAIGSNRFFVLAGMEQTITTGTISGSPFCAGNAVSIPFTITGNFTSGNIFTAQLSDAGGGFTSPVAIGSLTQTTAGTISGTIPVNALAGTLYRIRVVSNTPAVTGAVNISDLTVNPLPAIGLTVGGTGTIYSGTSANITIALSVSGTNYQLRNNTGNVNVGTPVAGTGGTINLPTGNLSSTTTFNVLATIASTSCSAQLTGTATVTVIAACITTQPSNVTICSGAGTSFSVVATGSPVYQWQVSIDSGGSWTNITAAGADPVYSGFTTSTLSLTGTVPSNNAYQYRCVLSGGCGQTSNAATLTLQIINISYKLSASPDLVETTGSINLNSTLTLSGSLTGVNYQLRDGTNGNALIGSPVTGTGGAISFAPVTPIHSTQYNVLATTAAGGCSAQITDTKGVTVNETGIIISLTTCNGQPGLNFFTNSNFGTTATNNYQTPDQGLFPGVILGNPLGAYTNYIYGLVSNAIPDGNYVIANSTAGMYRTPQQVMGRDVWLYTEDRSMTPGTGQMYIVNAANNPGLFYTETLSNLCENTRYEFRADVINLYAANWVPNGPDYLSYFPVDGQGNRYSILPNVDFMIDNRVALNTGDIMNDGSWRTYGFTFRTGPGQTSISFTMRNNSTGGIGNDIALDNIIMRACGPVIDITINTTLPVCPGVPVTMTANLIATDYVTPEYQWQKSTDSGVTWNNISGENAASYTSNNPAYGDEFRFIVAETTASLSNPNCSVHSNPVSITTTAGITGTTPGSICGSGTVTLRATANSGSTINWYANLTGGSSLGTGTSFTTPTISTTTTYYVEATNGGCRSNPRTSVVATINSNVTASISISSSTGNSICSGTSVTFTATPTNGGATPTYQWKLNGGNVGTNSSTYTTSSLANTDAVTCVMTSSISSCITGSPATSNTITMTVGTSVPASVSISANPGNTICQGTSVTFTAVPVNGGATPNYQWKNNGTDIFGAVSNTYTTSSLVQGDVIACVMTTSLGCATGSPATSNGITMTVNPLPAIGLTVGGTGSICTGTGTNVTIALSVSGTNYQLRDAGNVNVGAPIAGTGGTINLPTGNLTTTATFNVLATVGSSSCSAQLLSTKTITVNTLPVATFSYAGTPYCQNAANPSPTYSGGGVAGTFSSTAGLVFVSTATGQVNLAASTAGTYTVTNTIAASGGCGIVTATTSISIIGDRTWTGASNSDWNVSSNWSCNIIPDLTTNVTIPNVLNQPILSNGGIGAANNIVINNGSSLTIVSNTFQIAGTITNSGTFNATAGTIEMKGSSAQTIPAATFATNTIQNLTINNTSGVTLLGPLNVTGIVKASNGNLSSGGNLTLVSTSAQTALIDGSGSGDVTGNVVMQRYLPSGFGYKYFSSPFQGATVSQFSSYVNLSAPFPTFYRYDETSISSGWVNYTNSSGTLVPLNGYTVNFGTNPSPVTMSINGVVNNKTQTPITLTNHNQPYTLGFNLVGNPYPSPIDWDAASGWTKTNVDNAIYFFNTTGDTGNSLANDSIQYQGTYSSYVNGQGTGNATNIIPAMQGFFVHVSTLHPIDATLIFNNGIRINDLNPLFKSADLNPKPLLRLSAGFTDNGTPSDPAVIYFDDSATPSFDRDLDALKMMNTDTRVPNLYSISPDAKRLSISGIPSPTDSITRVPLGLKTGIGGWVTFNVSDMEQIPLGMHIYLVDDISRISQDVKSNPVYRTYLRAGNYENRFSLVFSLSELVAPPQLMVESEKFTITRPGGIISVNLNLQDNGTGILQMVNMAGQVLYRKEVFGNESIELNSHLSSGVYVISVITGNKIYSKKIIINKQ